MEKKVKINYNTTFSTTHSRDFYKGTSFHFSGEWMIGAHYNSDKYNIDFVVHDQVLLACAQSHLSSLDNEPIKYIRDERGTIKGVVSVYWDFVLSGIKGNSPGIKIVDKYWYTCEDTLLPEDKQVWINTGIKASFEFSDLTEDEIKILQQPGIDAAHGAVQAVIVQETGSNTDKIMSQDAVTKELNKKATKVELTEAIANEVARAENTYQPKGDYATNHRVDVVQQEVTDLRNSSNAEFTNIKTLITEEQERATAAESDLNTKIDTEISNRETTDTHLANLLKAEVIRATTEESKLNSKIDSEIANREATDTALTNALNSEITRATTAEEDIQDNLDSEITRATNKETELLNAINTEIADRKSAVQAEIDRATAAESALQSSLDAEIARAKSAEQTNATNIAKEVTDRTNAVSAEQTARINADNALDSRVTTIESKIPIQASSTNQLADKAFVNSSIATSTAVFKGTFTNLDTLKATPADDNDYAFYSHVDSNGNTKYDKYKYTASGWVFEYTLNNSSFTSEQWAAINSGATASIISTVPKSIEVVGTGNAVTAASLSSGKLTLSKNSTFLTSHQPLKTLTIQKNGTQVGTFNPATDGTINITDVASASTLTSHINNATVHVTEAERTKWNNASASLAGLTVTTTGSGNVISSITNNGSTITATKGITALTSHQSISHLLKIDGSNGTKEGVSALLRKLNTASANVLDATYIITSDNNGETSNPLYYRRSATSFWNYIKSKADTIYQPKGSYLTTHQTIYDLTIQGNGTTIGTFDPNGANKTINITPASIGLGNVRNQAFYERPVHINGDTWSLVGTIAADAFTIYAPITAGTSGQILKSTGGVPTWVDASGFIGSTAWADITSKPTTLAGYGITDAKIANGVITLGGNTIAPLTSHQSLANYVTLNTEQRIWGRKVFTTAPLFDHFATSSNHAAFVINKYGANYFGMGGNGVSNVIQMAKSNVAGEWISSDTSLTLKVIGAVQANSIARIGGTASQFLKADGSVDSNSYALSSSLANYTLTKAKVEGVLTGDITSHNHATQLAPYAKTADMTTELGKKVDKVTGKGLSTNDYTTAEKEKLGKMNIAPTLTHVPGATDLTFTDTYGSHSFLIGDFARVADTESEYGYSFYQLYDIKSGKAVWAKLGAGGDMSSTTEKLVITLTSNQGANDAALKGLVVHVKYGNVDESLTWAGQPMSVEIPGGADYKIVYPELTGYSTPPIDSRVALIGQTTNVTAEYKTEVVTVTLTASNSASCVGQKVTINGIEYSYNGPVSAKVAFGTEYSISANQKPAFKTPPSQTYTAGSASRGVTLTYTAMELGVFVYTTDGSLVKRENWKRTMGFKGVAVVSTKCQFRMGDSTNYNDRDGNGISWCSDNYRYVDIPAMAHAADEATAILDYKGLENTEAALEFASDIDGAVKASTTNYSTGRPDGGYLGSAGEWEEVLNNWAEVRDCFSLYYDTNYFYMNRFWTSTCVDKDFVWLANWGDNNRKGTFTKTRKYFTNSLISFYPLNT